MLNEKIFDKLRGRNLFISIAFVTVIVIAAIAWLMLRIPSGTGTNEYDNRVDERLESTQEQLDRAGESLERLERGIESGEGILDDIGGRNAGAQDAAERAAEADKDAQDAIGRAERIRDRCAELNSSSKLIIEKYER